jgi:hypothetical protein
MLPVCPRDRYRQTQRLSAIAECEKVCEPLAEGLCACSKGGQKQGKGIKENSWQSAHISSKFGAVCRQIWC